MPRHRICLASASPRRLDLLRAIGIEPLVRPSGVEEHRQRGEAPEPFAARIAAAKCAAVLESGGELPPASVVLAADTIVVLDGEILGKPRDPDEAATMLRRLRDRTHRVLTAVAVGRTDDPRRGGGVAETRVQFRAFDDRLIDAYVRTGEPLDKAGAYAIQERGALLASTIAGSWSNVVGLPLERLGDWLGDIGIELADVAEWARQDPANSE